VNEVPDIDVSVEIDAPAEQVWTLVSDLGRMADWSPQVVSTRIKGDGEIALGTRFTNLNQQGEMQWVTHAEVVRFDPGRELAFRVEENWAEWSLALEPTPTGTRVHQRRHAPDGISDLSRDLTEGFLGGQEAFTGVLRDGMTETLARLKAEAEAAASGVSAR